MRRVRVPRLIAAIALCALTGCSGDDDEDCRKQCLAQYDECIQEGTGSDICLYDRSVCYDGCREEDEDSDWSGEE